MIHEFAVEPTLLNNWQRFRYLIENFGVCHGRLISRYPKRWKKMVYEGLRDCTDIEIKKIEVKLQFIDDRMLQRNSEWNPEGNWLANAENEDTTRPFHAIMAGTNPRQNDRVLIADEIDEDSPLWKTERERLIPRRADSLAKAVQSLLSIARVIIFVDPYFSPGKPKSRNTLKAFLVKIVERNNLIPIERVEFHTRFTDSIPEFANECVAQLPQRIPAGIKVRIVRWKERGGGEGLHNRYILTERGGMRLAWGLDEGKPHNTDDLSLLDPGIYETRWNQYCSENPAFDIEEEIVIEGQLA